MSNEISDPVAHTLPCGHSYFTGNPYYGACCPHRAAHHPLLPEKARGDRCESRYSLARVAHVLVEVDMISLAAVDECGNRPMYLWQAAALTGPRQVLARLRGAVLGSADKYGDVVYPTDESSRIEAITLMPRAMFAPPVLDAGPPRPAGDNWTLTMLDFDMVKLRCRLPLTGLVLRVLRQIAEASGLSWRFGVPAVESRSDTRARRLALEFTAEQVAEYGEGKGEDDDCP